jgi:lipoprotein-anchoring transpeptidase ErfK/SrfK
VGTIATVAVLLGLGAAAFAAGVRPEFETLTAGPAVTAPPIPDAGDDGSAIAGGTVNGQAPVPVASARSRQAEEPTMPPASCAEGAWQRDVETALARLADYGPVVVDGRQSAADCVAITRFQHRFGLQPANGRADGQTAAVADRIVASLAPTQQAQCRPGPGLTACIDLTLQTVWVVRDGQLVFGPSVTRTGFRGHATPVGTFTINRRATREWSNPYEVWLPYWQHFVDGIGFHQTTTYLHDAARGSHGCINLLPDDAVTMWRLLTVGTTVRTFGHRAGT